MILLECFCTTQRSKMRLCRWNTVVFGDPLYAPFRTRAKRPDETPPAVERLALHALHSPGGGHRVLISAELAGATPEQADDVALWRVEYGLTPEYGKVVPFIEWPDPEDDKPTSPLTGLIATIYEGAWGRVLAARQAPMDSYDKSSKAPF